MMTTNAARMQSFLDAKAPDAKLTMVELKQAGVQIHAAIAEMRTDGAFAAIQRRYGSAPIN